MGIFKNKFLEIPMYISSEKVQGGISALSGGNSSFRNMHFHACIFAKLMTLERVTSYFIICLPETAIEAVRWLLSECLKNGFEICLIFTMLSDVCIICLQNFAFYSMIDSGF